jgi:hypothetical protein
MGQASEIVPVAAISRIPKQKRPEIFRQAEPDGTVAVAIGGQVAVVH